MKKWFLLIVVSIVGIGIFFVPMFISKEIRGAFDEIQSKLADKNAIEDSIIIGNRNDLLYKIDSMANSDSVFSNNLRIFVMSLDESYGKIQQELGDQISILSKGDILFEKDRSGKPSAMRYWMGENIESNEGHGNGYANELRQKINNFIYQILEENGRIATKLNLDTYFQPNILNQIEQGNTIITWERYTFNGSIMAIIPQLEVTKLDLTEIYKHEIQFLIDILTNHDLRAPSFRLTAHHCA